jgi:hypothetical protein
MRLPDGETDPDRSNGRASGHNPASLRVHLGKMRAPSLSADAVLAAALFLAGCSIPGAIAPPYYRGSYQPGETGIQGTMPTVVRGSPFPLPDVNVAAAVVDAMQGQTFWPTRFVPSTVNPQSSYRVVVLFSPPAAMPYPDLCSAPVLPSAPPQPQPPQAVPRTPVSVALCKWDVLMAATSSTIEASSPQDLRFRSVMAGLARALFPIRNPDDASINGMDFP